MLLRSPKRRKVSPAFGRSPARAEPVICRNRNYPDRTAVVLFYRQGKTRS